VKVLGQHHQHRYINVHGGSTTPTHIGR
jgi:hypothetical protein